MKQGYTVLELIISLALIAPIAVGIAQFSVLLGKNYYTLKAQYESTRAIARSLDLIETAFRRLDSYPLDISPRIHSVGNITYTDNSVNPVVNSSKVPDTISDALTSISVSSNSIYRITNYQKIGQNLEYTACLPFESNVHNTKAKTFIGLSSENNFELVGQSQRILGQARCRKFSLRHTKSMIIPDLGQSDLDLIKVLLPVASYSTLYLDQSGILRYLSHRGTTNIENQPLVEKLKKISFSLNRTQDFYELNTKITSLFNKTQKHSFLNNLARTDKSNLISLIE